MSNIHPEQNVVRIIEREWCAVLAVNNCASDDDFFDLGGTSLTAMELIERLERALNYSIPLEALFVEGTLASLTRSCLQHSKAERDIA